MTDRIPDPAGWNRIRELESQLHTEREGRAIERVALRNAMDLLAAPEPICDGLTPIDTTGTDYKAGEADGYEHGWKARDRELWESRTYSEDEVLSALNRAGIVRGGVLMNQILEQLHGGDRRPASA